MPSTPILRSLALALALTILPQISASSYSLADDYTPSNFFSKFDFYTGGDPTNGFVQFVNESYASEHSLIETSSGYVTIGVDTTHVYAPAGGGRPSLRLSSTANYTHALYILDLVHMPHGCGTWPAFWSLGPDWPSHGEIDIIEGVNVNTNNLISLHSSANCTTAGANQTGTLETSDCYIDVDNNAGCSVQATSTDTYGSAFNKGGGGIYAMEWTSSYIRVWSFAASDVPSSITSGKPDPTTFGVPIANYQGSCDIDTHFGEHKIIFDITFCGDYAGNTYGSTACPMTSGASGYDSCVDFVANNPKNFTEAYWQINSLKVYQSSSSDITASTLMMATSLSSVTAAASTSSALLSSIVNAGEGVNSSSTSIGSSTLSIPASTSGASSTSYSSTYTGPNTVTTGVTTAIMVDTYNSGEPNFASPYAYVGCWTDQGSDRTLRNQYALPSLGGNKNMTVENCAATCNSYGYALMGVEYYYECYCDSEISNSASTSAPEGDCNTPCYGDATEDCGGPDRLNLYSLALTTITSTTQTTKTTTTTTTTSKSSTGSSTQSSPTGYGTGVTTSRSTLGDGNSGGSSGNVSTPASTSMIHSISTDQTTLPTAYDTSTAKISSSSSSLTTASASSSSSSSKTSPSMYGVTFSQATSMSSSTPMMGASVPSSRSSTSISFPAYPTASVTNSSTTGPTALPTTTDMPQCHSIFMDISGGTYRIYCNSTIDGSNLRQTTTSSFTNCITLCNSYNSTCIGAVYDNSTFPPLCSLRTSQLYTSMYRAKRETPLSYMKGVFAALHLQNSAYTAPSDPPGYGASSVLSPPAAYTTSTIPSYVTSTSVVTSVVGTTTMTTTSGGSSAPLGYTTSVSLCYTCGITPAIISTVVTPSNYGSSVPTQITSRYSTSSSPILKYMTTSGSCPARKSVTVTLWIQQTISTCATPLTCPAPTTGMSPSASSVSGSGSSPHGPRKCSSGFIDGQSFVDASGMEYYIDCGELVTSETLQISTANNLLGCMAACDMWNIVNHGTQPSNCEAVSFLSDTKSSNCLLKASGTPYVLKDGCDSAILMTGVDNGGYSDGSGSGSASESGSASGSGSGSGNGNGSGASGGYGGYGSLGGTAVYTSALITTHISNGHTILSTYGYTTVTTTTSTTTTTTAVVTSYIVSIHVSNGQTYLSTYGYTTVPGYGNRPGTGAATGPDTGAGTGVSTPYLVSTKVSNGQTLLSTIAYTTVAAGTATVATGGGSGGYGSGGVVGSGSTAISTSYQISTFVSNGHTVISTYGYMTVAAGTSTATATAVSYQVSTYFSAGSTVLSTYGISTVTGPGGTFTIAGPVSTVTGPDSTVYVTQISTVVSFSVSYVYSTEFEMVTATATVAPASPASSTSSSYCRTVATHYARMKKRGSVLKGPDWLGQYLGSDGAVMAAMPAARPVVAGW